MNFENFKNLVDFICQPAARQNAIRPGWAWYRANLQNCYSYDYCFLTFWRVMAESYSLFLTFVALLDPFDPYSLFKF